MQFALSRRRRIRWCGFTFIKLLFLCGDLQPYVVRHTHTHVLYLFPASWFSSCLFLLPAQRALIGPVISLQTLSSDSGLSLQCTFWTKSRWLSCPANLQYNYKCRNPHSRYCCKKVLWAKKYSLTDCNTKTVHTTALTWNTAGRIWRNKNMTDKYLSVA